MMLCVRNCWRCAPKTCEFGKNWPIPASLAAAMFHAWKQCTPGMQSGSDKSSTNLVGRTSKQSARTERKHRGSLFSMRLDSLICSEGVYTCCNTALKKGASLDGM